MRLRYRDIKNVVDTTRAERLQKRMEKGRNTKIAIGLKKNGISTEIIIQSTGLTKEEIENL